MDWFKIDGREWKVRVLEPEQSFQILYSENTGRVIDDRATMILDPIGTFFNYKLTVGKKNGETSDFDDLWEYLATPRKKAMLVVLPRDQKKWETETENGKVEGFYAYVSSGKRKIKKVIEEKSGELKEVIYDSFDVNFIASEAQVIPNEQD